MKFSNLKVQLLNNIGTRQTILKNTLWLSLSELISKGVYFLVFVWLARHFGPEIYGQWAFALSFVGICVILVDFGFKTLIIQELARDKSKSEKYVGNILSIKIILSIFFFAVVNILVRFLSKDGEIISLVCFLAFYIVLDNFAIFFQAIFRAREKMEYEAMCRITQSMGLITLSAVFIINNSSILVMSYAYIFAALLGVLFSLFLISHYFFKPLLNVDLKIWKDIFKKAWPFFFSAVFYMIYFGIGSVMLGIFSNMKEVGFYNAAYNLFIAVFIIPEIITMSFFPKLSYFYKEDKAQFKKMFVNFKLIMIVIGSTSAIILFFFSRRLITMIYSPEYAVSIVFLKILSLAVIFKFLSYAYSWFLVSSDEQKQALKAKGLGALLNIIFNYFLIIKYGAIGAVVSIFITEIFLLFFYYLFFKIKWKNIYNLTLI
jgi:O-antigen/teichoic acid export membrane protein